MPIATQLNAIKKYSDSGSPRNTGPYRCTNNGIVRPAKDTKVTECWRSNIPYPV